MQSIVKDTARDDEMVQRLLDFKAYADKAASESFVDSIPTPPVGTSVEADKTNFLQVSSEVPITKQRNTYKFDEPEVSCCIRNSRIPTQQM